MTTIEQQNVIVDTTQFENPDTFREKITELQDKLPFVLEDFKKNYVLYNKDTEYNEYQQTFEVSKSNLQQLNTDLSTIETNVDTNTNKLNEQLNEINTKIADEKEENIILKTKLGLLEDGSNSANEMIHDYKKKYNLAYLRNWGLLLSILVSWLTMKYVFKSFHLKLEYSK
jgi:chromosome segregation ATPase